jgi:hypothetical protein
MVNKKSDGSDKTLSLDPERPDWSGIELTGNFAS